MRMRPNFCSTPCAAMWRTTSASPGVQPQVGAQVHLHVCSECVVCCHRCLASATCILPVTQHSQHALLAPKCCWVSSRKALVRVLPSCSC